MPNAGPRHVDKWLHFDPNNGQAHRFYSVREMWHKDNQWLHEHVGPLALSIAKRQSYLKDRWGMQPLPDHDIGNWTNIDWLIINKSKGHSGAGLGVVVAAGHIKLLPLGKIRAMVGSGRGEEDESSPDH
jgi:hypothetical protein